MSIRFKLVLSYFMVIIITVGVLGILAGKKSKDAVFNEVREKGENVTELINTTVSVRNDLLLDKSYSDSNYAKNLLNDLGDLRIEKNENIKVGDYNLPVLYAGDKRISLDTNFVDNIKVATDTICSIFLLKDDKLIRISTNVMKDEQRAVGTYFDINSDVYNKIINKEEYSGMFKFNDETYVSRTKPLYDKDQKVIGAIGVGNKVINSYLESKLNDIKIGKKGYVYVLDSKGNCILHPEMKGQNASEYDFVQKIISTKNGTIEYTFKGVHKIAFYKYFEPWDWYIVTTANYDDLQASSKDILNIILFIGLIIAALGVIMALLFTNIFVKPIKKLKSYMEIASTGDLSIRSDIKRKDEIGILSDSFNHMMDENKRLMEKTIQYDKLKTEFIANMSHELRTPLNIIFCIAQLFHDSINRGEIIDNNKLSDYIGTMKQNCNRLLRLVNNLIDISKIDSEFMELNLKNQNIVEVVEEITLSTAQYVEGMSRTIIFDTNIEEKIMAIDEEKMERIILNLISNATKFTQPGGKIEVSMYDEDKYIVISVKDNGVGIPQEKIQQVFERFKQVDSLMNRKHEGSGIGLAIVKALVEMHQGIIRVKSKYGEGTEFTIILPVKIIDGEHNEEYIKDAFSKSDVGKIEIEFSDIYN